MKTNRNRNAELMLRIYESVIFPGKCQHLSRNEREVFRSVWSYDITYLYPSVYQKNDTDWMEFGLFDSKKVGRMVPFYNIQQERFLQLSEECVWIENFVECPMEIIYQEDFTLAFTPDYLLKLADGSIVILMLQSYKLFSTQDVQKKWHSLMEYCKKHGYGCVMFDLIKGISLKWLLGIWRNKDMSRFENEVLSMLNSKNSHWMDGITLSKIMDKHHANLFDFQVLVLKNNLLFIPQNGKRKVDLIKSHGQNLFDSQLMIDSYAENNTAQRRNYIRVRM